jgi:hypothetical protein
LKPNYNSVDLTEVEHVDNNSNMEGSADPGVIEVSDISARAICYGEGRVAMAVVVLCKIFTMKLTKFALKIFHRSHTKLNFPSCT